MPVSAQSVSAVENPDEPVILNLIEQSSGGSVSIDIPKELEKLLCPSWKPETKDKTVAPSSNTRQTVSSGPKQISGYRIQIFSDGRDQRTLQSRANARSNSVIAKFPKYRNQVYSFSKAPNWYTRVGNFRTYNEATAALAELKRAFPAFAGEMRIVKSNIIVVD